MYTPSNFPVKLLYCLCLLLAGRPLYNGAHTLLLLLGSAGTLGIMNILVAVVPSATTALLFLLVVARFFGVALGKFNLQTVATTGPIRVLRITAVCLMAFSALPWLLSLAVLLFNRGAESVGAVFLLGNLGIAAPLGILLFEASRLLEREVLVETKRESDHA